MEARKSQFVTLTLNPAWDNALMLDGPVCAGGVLAVCSEALTVGGKGINLAKSLAVNGRRTVAGGLLGFEDADRFCAAVAALGIEPRFMKVPGRVRTNLTICAADAEIKLNRPGFPDLEWDDAGMSAYFDELTADAEVVVISGSLPARFPPDTYGRLIGGPRARGRPVVLDCAGEALVRGVAAGPCVIKPNRRELAQLAGGMPPDDAAMETVIRRMACRHEIVIVSDGAAGAWFAGEGRLLWGPSPAVERRVDTTGAGDAMLGQFCADYFPRRRLTEAVAARALAAGAAAVERAGTAAPAPARVAELAETVRVGEIT